MNFWNWLGYGEVPDSYSAGAEFESRPTYRIFWLIVWGACCRQYGMCWQPLLWQRINTQQWATMQQWKCFLCGLFTGYITKGTSHSKPRRTDRLVVGRNVTLTLSENSTEEWVDGQWEPVGSAGGPGPWRNSTGVVTQLWESVVIVRRLGKCCGELWSCKSVYTVIVCNCVWSNKSSCQSNTHLI
jgi:hypothetical protein